MSGHDASLPPAVDDMVSATNAEDREAFIAAFTPDAVVDDFGRRFTGHGEIQRWSDDENIGTHNRITVTSVETPDGEVHLDIQVSGDGYNGSGTFVVRLQDDLIASLLIRG